MVDPCCESGDSIHTPNREKVVVGQRMIRFSDLSNRIIEDNEPVVRVVVEKHPALQDGPVELEVAIDEAEAIRKGSLNVVSLKLYQDGLSETITMEIETFNSLAGEMDMSDVLKRGEPAYAPRKPAPLPATEKLDYSSLEHAGKPHRGKTTEAEKKTVRENLDAINERLARDGMRTIDPNDPQMIERYGLEAPAKEIGYFQQ